MFTRGDHKSVRVRFVPNLLPTPLAQVKDFQTRRRLARLSLMEVKLVQTNIRRATTKTT